MHQGVQSRVGRNDHRRPAGGRTNCGAASGAAQSRGDRFYCGRGRVSTAIGRTLVTVSLMRPVKRCVLQSGLTAYCSVERRGTSRMASSSESGTSFSGGMPGSAPSRGSSLCVGRRKRLSFLIRKFQVKSTGRTFPVKLALSRLIAPDSRDLLPATDRGSARHSPTRTRWTPVRQRRADEIGSGRISAINRQYWTALPSGISETPVSESIRPSPVWQRDSAQAHLRTGRLTADLGQLNRIHRGPTPP